MKIVFYSNAGSRKTVPQAISVTKNTMRIEITYSYFESKIMSPTYQSSRTPHEIEILKNKDHHNNFMKIFIENVQ